MLLSHPDTEEARNGRADLSSAGSARVSWADHPSPQLHSPSHFAALLKEKWDARHPDKSTLSRGLEDPSYYSFPSSGSARSLRKESGEVAWVGGQEDWRASPSTRPSVLQAASTVRAP